MLVLLFDSFITVITKGLINCLSESLSSLILCFWPIDLFNSFSTRSLRSVGTPLLPFCCIGVMRFMNCVFITWFLDFPIQTHSRLKFCFTHYFISLSEFLISCILRIWLCFGFFYISAILVFSRMLRPTIFAFCSSTILNEADCTVQPPDSIATISRPFGFIYFPL